MKVSTSFSTAKKLLGEIPHITCQRAIQNRWRRDSNDGVTAQSVLWLFCWAKNGMGSGAAESKAKEIFDHLRPEGRSFADFDRRVGYPYAVRNRYSSDADVEHEVKRRLAKGAEVPGPNKQRAVGATVSPGRTAKVSEVSTVPADPSAIKWAVSFIDRFEKPGEKLGTHRGLVKQPDGTTTFPYVAYSKVVLDFIDGLYKRDIILNFDWPNWERGKNLYRNVELIARATSTDCLKLITMCVRNDRFVDGFLMGAIKSGVITGCLKRLRELSPGQT